MKFKLFKLLTIIISLTPLISLSCGFKVDKEKDVGIDENLKLQKYLIKIEKVIDGKTFQINNQQIIFDKNNNQVQHSGVIKLFNIEVPQFHKFLNGKLVATSKEEQGKALKVKNYVESKVLNNVIDFYFLDVDNEHNLVGDVFVNKQNIIKDLKKNNLAQTI